MIPDHCGFPMSSDFQSDRPLTMRTAIVTANWRGCEGAKRDTARNAA
jgi:hypothetical protein